MNKYLYRTLLGASIVGAAFISGCDFGSTTDSNSNKDSERIVEDPTTNDPDELGEQSEFSRSAIDSLFEELLVLLFLERGLGHNRCYLMLSGFQ